MQTDKAVAHLALDLRTRHERGHGVDHDDVDRAGAHERLGDLERLLAGVGLGDEHVLHLHAQRAGIRRVERVLRVDEGDLAAELLCLREDVQRERRLTGGLRPVDLDDAPSRQAADAQRQIQRQRAGGDGLDIGDRPVAIAHDGALAIHLLDLLHGRFERLLLIGNCGGRRCGFFLCRHNPDSSSLSFRG